jgi:hypothetical protein
MCPAAQRRMSAPTKAKMPPINSDRIEGGFLSINKKKITPSTVPKGTLVRWANFFQEVISYFEFSGTFANPNQLLS